MILIGPIFGVLLVEQPTQGLGGVGGRVFVGLWPLGVGIAGVSRVCPWWCGFGPLIDDLSVDVFELPVVGCLAHSEVEFELV